MLLVIDPHLARRVWERDQYRCQECGIAVAGARGCKPQTHHIRARSLGGSDDLENLTTLCFFCHATKASPGHHALLTNTPPELLTDLVKWLLWDLATNLLGYAEWLPPRRFPAEQVLRDLRGWRTALDAAIDHTNDLAQANGVHVVRSGGFDANDAKDPARGLAGVLIGLERSWYSDRVQRYLDGELNSRV